MNIYIRRAARGRHVPQICNTRKRKGILAAVMYRGVFSKCIIRLSMCAYVLYRCQCLISKCSAPRCMLLYYTALNMFRPDVLHGSECVLTTSNQK